MVNLLPEPFVKASHRLALHVRWGDFYLKSVQEGNFAHGSDKRIDSRKLERCLRRMDLHHTSHFVERNRSMYLFAASDMPKMLHGVIQGMRNFSWARRFPKVSNIHMLPESKSLHTGRKIQGNSMDKSFRPAVYDFLGLSLSDLIYAPAASTFSRQASEFGLIKLIHHCWEYGETEYILTLPQVYWRVSNLALIVSANQCHGSWPADPYIFPCIGLTAWMCLIGISVSTSTGSSDLSTGLLCSKRTCQVLLTSDFAYIQWKLPKDLCGSK